MLDTIIMAIGAALIAVIALANFSHQRNQRLRQETDADGKREQ